MMSDYVRANAAQALVNVLFGAASVVSLLSLKEFNMVLFGLVRAVLTTIFLVFMRWDERLLCASRLRVRVNDVGRFCAAGLFLFVG